MSHIREAVSVQGSALAFHTVQGSALVFHTVQDSALVTT